MAETPFERDLQAMFDDSPSASDSEAFVQAVNRRLRRGRWLQAGLLTAFGLTGLVLSLLLAGPTLFDLSWMSGLTDLAGLLGRAASLDAAVWSDARLWGGGLMLLIVGLLLLRPSLTEA